MDTEYRSLVYCCILGMSCHLTDMTGWWIAVGAKCAMSLITMVVNQLRTTLFLFTLMSDQPWTHSRLPGTVFVLHGDAGRPRSHVYIRAWTYCYHDSCVRMRNIFSTCRDRVDMSANAVLLRGLRDSVWFDQAKYEQAESRYQQVVASGPAGSTVTTEVGIKCQLCVFSRFLRRPRR